MDTGNIGKHESLDPLEDDPGPREEEPTRKPEAKGAAKLAEAPRAREGYWRWFSSIWTTTRGSARARGIPRH
jgi:hypothetical protein